MSAENKSNKGAWRHSQAEIYNVIWEISVKDAKKWKI